MCVGVDAVPLRAYSVKMSSCSGATGRLCSIVVWPTDNGEPSALHSPWRHIVAVLTIYDLVQISIQIHSALGHHVQPELAGCLEYHLPRVPVHGQRKDLVVTTWHNCITFPCMSNTFVCRYSLNCQRCSHKPSSISGRSQRCWLVDRTHTLCAPGRLVVALDGGGPVGL